MFTPPHPPPLYPLLMLKGRGEKDDVLNSTEVTRGIMSPESRKDYHGLRSWLSMNSTSARLTISDLLILYPVCSLSLATILSSLDNKSLSALTIRLSVFGLSPFGLPLSLLGISVKIPPLMRCAPIVQSCKPYHNITKPVNIRITKKRKKIKKSAINIIKVLTD